MKNLVVAQAVRDAFPDAVDVADRYLRSEFRKSRILRRSHVFWFRFVGAIEILFSASLPILFQFLDFTVTAERVAATIVSIAVTVAASLSAFFGWSQNWETYTQQSAALNTLIAEWELHLMALLTEESPRRQSEGLQATRSLIEMCATVIRDGAHEVFDQTRLANVLLERNRGAADGQDANGEPTNPGAS